MTVLQTRYDGCHFRSRLEARWAVFFNTLGIAWDYEPEVYESGDGVRYLPDFWLPELGVHVEVKGDLTGLAKSAGQLTAAIPALPTPLLLLGPIPRASGGRATHWAYGHRAGQLCRALCRFTDTGTLQADPSAPVAAVAADHPHDLAPHLGHPYDYEWAHGPEAAACTAATYARFDTGRPRRGAA